MRFANNWNAGATRMPSADRAGCSGWEAVVVGAGGGGTSGGPRSRSLKIPQPLDEMPLLF